MISTLKSGADLRNKKGQIQTTKIKYTTYCKLKGEKILLECRWRFNSPASYPVLQFMDFSFFQDIENYTLMLPCGVTGKKS